MIKKRRLAEFDISRLTHEGGPDFYDPCVGGSSLDNDERAHIL